MTAKTLFTGKSHITSGPGARAVSADGFLDIGLAQPHPAAENLFGAAWSTCFIAALGVAAGQRKVKLPTPPSVDAQIDLIQDASGFFLKAKLDVSVPGIDAGLARELVDAAHEICPYSKATRGNIEVEINLA
jgi:lipoyl-dependent peroxiredoxin